MPKGDRTGPVGAGPATRRGLGFCTGFKSTGYSLLRRGFGGRRRRGMFWSGCMLPGCVYLAYRWGKQNKNF